MASSLRPSPDTEPPSAASKNKLTILDRSVSPVLENPDETASRQAGVDPYTERLHRFHGTSVVFECCRGLSLQPSTFATACTIFHRFCHATSLTEYDVWSVAMASTLLATKVEDEPKSLKQFIEEHAKIYARRLVLADLSRQQSGNNSSNSEKTLEDLVQATPQLAFLRSPIEKWRKAEDRRRVCDTRLPQQLNKFGPVYKEWYEQITKMESILLRQLGFTFHWISDSHPHKFILNFCQALELHDAKFAQRAWDYCNDSCRLDLSLRYLPEIIASSSILLAARDFDAALPVEPRPWWEVFVGSETEKGQQVVDAANAILGTSDLGTSDLRSGTGKDRGVSNEGEDDDDTKYRVSMLAASKGFLRSLVNTSSNGDAETSFNDPDSFLWFCQKEIFEKEMKNNE